jgi:SAM-dependent methyltransferase
MDEAAAVWRVLEDLEQRAWALGAVAALLRSGALSATGLMPSSDDEVAAARVLVAVGLASEAGDGDFSLVPGMAAFVGAEEFPAQAAGLRSSLGQLTRVLGLAPGDGEAEGWAAQSDETLRAQGRGSAMGGTMLARMVVPTLPGLAERFAAGGDFLDVGVGVGELAAAFCDALPQARVVGLDVMPRVLRLAAETVASRGLADRLELRECGVQALADVDRFDLAWLPAPFIPEAVFDVGLARLVAAVRPGGWLVVGAGRLEGDPLAVALTRWKTALAGGTALGREDAERRLGAVGFVDVQELPTPPGAPVLYAARRPAVG